MFQKIVLGIGALASAQALSSTAVAQTTGEWPERSVTMYVGFAPGGANSNVTRILADQLTKRLGQQFVVEHLPGAGGRVAASTVAGEPADGYTFFTGAPGEIGRANV